MQQKILRARLPRAASAPALRRRPERDASLIAERRARAPPRRPVLGRAGARRSSLPKGNAPSSTHPGHDKASVSARSNAEAFLVIGLVRRPAARRMIARARPVQTGLDHRGAKAERAIIAGHRERPEQQRRAPRPGLMAIAARSDEPAPSYAASARPAREDAGAQLLAKSSENAPVRNSRRAVFARENIVRRFVVDDEAGGCESRVGRGLKGKIKVISASIGRQATSRLALDKSAPAAGTGRTKGFSRLSPARARKTVRSRRIFHGAKPLKQIEE